MDSPDRAVIVELAPGIEIVNYLNVGDPDPTPDELEAIAIRYAMMGGVASARVVDRHWFGRIHYTPDQLAALGGGDSYAYDVTQ